MMRFQTIDDYSLEDLQGMLNQLKDTFKMIDTTNIIKFPQAKGFERGELVLCQKSRNII